MKKANLHSARNFSKCYVVMDVDKHTKKHRPLVDGYNSIQTDALMY